MTSGRWLTVALSAALITAGLHVALSTPPLSGGTIGAVFLIVTGGLILVRMRQMLTFHTHEGVVR